MTPATKQAVATGPAIVELRRRFVDGPVLLIVPPPVLPAKTWSERYRFFPFPFPLPLPRPDPLSLRSPLPDRCCPMSE